MTKGERIRRLREERSLTQEDLAKLLNTKRQTVSKYEKNIVTNIPSDKLEELAKVLNTTPEYILGWENEKPTTVADDGLSQSQRELIAFAQTVPEDRAAWVLSVMKKILESD